MRNIPKRSITLWRTLLRPLAVCLALLPLSLHTVRAQQEQFDENHPVIKQVAKTLGALNSLTANFQCTVKHPTAKADIPIAGTIKAKGSSYVIKAEGLEIYADEKSRWQFLPEDNEVTITTLDDASPLDQPMQIFSRYNELFKVRYRGEHTKDGKRFYDMTLYPRDLSQSYSQIHLSVNAKTYYPEKITYQAKDGGFFLISLSNFKANPTINDPVTFDPKKYPGIEIIDLR